MSNHLHGSVFGALSILSIVVGFRRKYPHEYIHQSKKKSLYSLMLFYATTSFLYSAFHSFCISFLLQQGWTTNWNGSFSMALFPVHTVAQQLHRRQASCRRDPAVRSQASFKPWTFIGTTVRPPSYKSLSCHTVHPPLETGIGYRSITYCDCGSRTASE